MRAVDMTRVAVTQRLRRISELSNLSADKRLDTKIDMSAEAVSRRLLVQSRLRDSCLTLAGLGRAAGLISPRRSH